MSTWQQEDGESPVSLDRIVASMARDQRNSVFRESSYKITIARGSKTILHTDDLISLQLRLLDRILDFFIWPMPSRLLENLSSFFDPEDQSHSIISRAITLSVVVETYEKTKRKRQAQTVEQIKNFYLQTVQRIRLRYEDQSAIDSRPIDVDEERILLLTSIFRGGYLKTFGKVMDLNREFKEFAKIRNLEVEPINI